MHVDLTGSVLEWTMWHLLEIFTFTTVHFKQFTCLRHGNILTNWLF